MTRDAPDGFWARRRARVAEEAEAEARAAEAARTEEESARLAAQMADKSDAEILAELNLPDPADLLPGQDISAFMKKAVPQHLRRQAMRQLWRLNPALAVLDGLNDYDGDFTNAATDAPGVKTSYRVGQGLLRHVEALARKEQDSREGLTAQIPDDDVATGENAEIEGKMQDEHDAADASATKVAMSDPQRDETVLTADAQNVRPRRMRFSFDTETE